MARDDDTGTQNTPMQNYDDQGNEVRQQDTEGEDRDLLGLDNNSDDSM